MKITETIRDMITNSNGEYTIIGYDNAITALMVLDAIGVEFADDRDLKYAIQKVQATIGSKYIAGKILNEGYVFGGVERKPRKYFIASNQLEMRALGYENIKHTVGHIRRLGQRTKAIEDFRIQEKAKRLYSAERKMIESEETTV